MAWRRIGSIEIRLTLILGVIAFVVSVVAGCTLFWALQREVQRQEMTEVSGKFELIDHLVGMQSPEQALDGLHSTLDNILVGHENLKVWIVMPDGRVVYGDAPPRTVRTLADHEVLLQTREGWNMRGLRLRLEGPVLPGAELTVAINSRPSTQFLYAFATALVLICALWVGATVVLSAWAVRRSLSPFRRLSQQAARIRPANLAVRLPEQGVDRELREFTHTFNAMLDRVQAAYQQMEGFNADVAHELRTPLTTLINSTEVMLSSPRSIEELREVMASNLEELESLKVLINDMLFLARADGGERARDLQKVQVREEVARVAEYYEAALEEAGVTLRAHGEGVVHANPRLLRRAIANLVSNAIKATPRGESFDVHCTPLAGAVELRVRNPGTPIATDALPRIFDRFFRTDDARSGRAVGHGLGLAIVSAIARMHGGAAFARSDPSGSEVGFVVNDTAHITKM